ncbi:MAG TPA: thioredoxin family protein [Polyangiales bacterium]|nr:thioredoxin family protein [Polyangiales bacterium]
MKGREHAAECASTQAGIGLLVALLLSLLGCGHPAADGGSANRPVAPPKPRLIDGPTGAADVTPFIAQALAEANAEHAPLLVYVGASWCEPCQHFHDALTRGELDRSLPGVRFVAFDLDASKPALMRAGYISKLIPLFTFPNLDGTASDRHIEGSIKGPTAVGQNLLPRLRELLASPVTKP